MSLYTVTEPCVIDQLHYATVPTQPIEVDDEVAAPLVEAGSLVAYRAAVPTDHTGVAEGDPNVDLLPTGDFAPADGPAEKPSRRSRRAVED